MYLEYCNYNKTISNYGDELSNVFRAIDAGINCLSIPIHMYQEIREFMPEGIDISIPIDFPCGYSATKTKNHAVLNAVKSGVKSVDYVMNNYLFQEKPKELEKELKVCLSICRDYNSTLRVFIDPKTTESVIGTAKYLYQVGVEFCYPCIGYHNENFVDTLINCKLIEKDTPMNTIFNGYFWREDQLQILKRSNIFGIRLYNIDFWCNYS